VDAGLDPLRDDASGDVDGDGWANLAEYLWETDAGDPASRPAARVGYSIASNEDLYEVELLTGASRYLQDLVISGDIEGAAFGQDRRLYAVDESFDRLYRIDRRFDGGLGPAIAVGDLGVNVDSVGLAFDEDGVLWMAATVIASSSVSLYRIDVITGRAALVGEIGFNTIDSLAFDGQALYGISTTNDSLYRINRASGNATLVGSLGLAVGSTGLASDSRGRLVGVSYDGSLRVFRVDAATGRAKTLALVTSSPGFRTLAIEGFFDADGDGLPDYWERRHGLAPADPADAALDTDGDGLTNLEEYAAGADPRAADTDGDGLGDADEIRTHGLDPANPDTDADGLADGAEVLTHGTDPWDPDTDGDGMLDGWEVEGGLDPLRDDAALDPDGDGWTNREEHAWQTNAGEPASRPAARFGYSVSTAEDLYEIDLLTGSARRIGALGFSGDVEGLEFGQDRRLYAVDESSGRLYRVDRQTGAATVVGSLGVSVSGAGLAVDDDGVLWMTSNANLYRVDTETGRATLVGTDVLGIDSLAWNGEALYGLSVVTDSLYTIDRASGSATLVGSLGGIAFSSSGLASESRGVLVGIATSPQRVFRLDAASGRATLLSQVSSAPTFRTLAIDGFRDTDRDGLPDYWERRYGLDPADPADAALDADGDGLTSLAEYDAGSSPNAADTDGDGLGDAEEVATYATDPANPDTDGDGLSDGAEVELHGTRPLDPDTDDDGMPDGFEVEVGLDPLRDDAAGDLDGDGWSNREEYLWDTDIADPGSRPAARVGYSISNSSPPELSEIDLLTGATRRIASLGTSFPFPEFSGLDFGLDRQLYGIEAIEDRLYRIDPRTGAITAIGSLGVNASDVGAAFDEDGVLWMVSGFTFYRIDVASGRATPVGTTGVSLESLAWDGEALYGLGNQADSLYRVDRATGAATLVGPLETFAIGSSGLAADSRGELVGIGFGPLRIYRVDKATGRGTTLAQTSSSASYRTLAIEGFRDRDRDGLPDYWERQHDLDPADPADAALDPDGDGLTSLEEYGVGSDPRASDTDGDGLDDGEEVRTHETDPGDPDTDGDGAEDGAEVDVHGTDPLDPDTDGDGMPDGYEVDSGLDPLRNDAAGDLDGDGWTNLDESRWQTDASDPRSKPTARFGYSISNFRELYEIDLRTGATRRIGSLGSNIFGDFEGLEFGQDRQLYAVDDSTDQLYRIDRKTGAATLIGGLGSNVSGAGLAFDDDNALWMVASSSLYRVDLATGLASRVGVLGTGVSSVDSLAFADGSLYGISVQTDSLYRIDRATGLATPVGPIAPITLGTSGLSSDSRGILIGLADNPLRLFRVDKATGAAAILAQPGSAQGFKSLAIEGFRDSDLDGLPDYWERRYGLDPADPADAAIDPDGDLLSQLDEYEVGTDPTATDTDADGLLDGLEVLLYRTDPLDPDTDADGLSDGAEIAEHGSDPLLPDTDADGIPDGWEVAGGLDPRRDDTREDLDGDGWSNGEEYRWDTDPSDPDARPAARIGYAISTSSILYEVELATGATRQIGALGVAGSFGGMDFGQDRRLYAVDESLDRLYRIDVGTGAATRIGNLGVDVGFVGLAFDEAGFLWMVAGHFLYRVDTATGGATLVGGTGVSLNTLAWAGGTLYANGSQDGKLYRVDPASGVATPIGAIGLAAGVAGLASDSRGELVGLGSYRVFRVDETTGRGTVLANTTNTLTLDGFAIEGFRDSDRDGSPDYWESRHGLDPADPADAGLDPDVDGLTNVWEYAARSDPHLADTDGDGFSDAAELIFLRTDPASPDTDADGLPDPEEFERGTDPRDPDSDDDIMTDGYEVEVHLDPRRADGPGDPDRDGWTNREEFLWLSDATDPRSRPGTRVGYSISSSDHLYEIQLLTGTVRAIGSLGVSGDFEALDFGQDRKLYAVDDSSDRLYTIDRTTGAATLVGSLGVAVDGVGVAFDEDGVLWMSAGRSLYRVDTATGGATWVGDLGVGFVDSLAWDGEALYGISIQSDSLYRIDRQTGATTLVGPLGNLDLQGSGLASESRGVLVAISRTIAPFRVYRVDQTTGLPTLIGQSTGTFEFRTLAIEGFRDSDADGLPDYWERRYGLDPANPNDPPLDPDGDGLSSQAEYAAGSDPSAADTDGDGLLDGAEVLTHGTRPGDPDTDRDGLLDGAEVLTHRTDPRKADTDNDGMPDGFEVQFGLDPLRNDTAGDRDGDGWTNREEYAWGTDVSDPASRPAARIGYAMSTSEQLYEVELATGALRLIGVLDFVADFQGLELGRDQQLYGVDSSSDRLFRIDRSTAAATPIGSLGVNVGAVGLSFDEDGALWMAAGLSLYRIDTTTGRASYAGDLGTSVDSLAFAGDALYGINPTGDGVFRIDRTTGRATFVGPLETVALSASGLASDSRGELVGISFDTPHRIFRVNAATGRATVLAQTASSPGFKTLAVSGFRDSDRDGLPDWWEREYGLDPADPADAALDPDGDGLTHVWEYAARTHPLQPDTDGDGLVDGVELFFVRSDPADPDTDGDSLLDGAEVDTHGTSPLKPDTDDDGMPDAFEVDAGLDPVRDDAAGDLDGDGWTNFEEYGWQTDVSDPASRPGARYGYSIADATSDALYEISLVSGLARRTGFLGVNGQYGALAFGPDGRLYAVDETLDRLVRINPSTGAAVVIGSLGVNVGGVGLAFDGSGVLWMVGGALLFRVDVATGAATLATPLTTVLDSLAWSGESLYGIHPQTGAVYRVDRTSGAATLIGPLGIANLVASGLDTDGRGLLIGVSYQPYQLFSVDAASGQARLLVQPPASLGFRSLAIASVPGAALQGVPSPAQIPALPAWGIALLLALLAAGGRPLRTPRSAKSETSRIGGNRALHPRSGPS
jgi:streptogramin lyase